MDVLSPYILEHISKLNIDKDTVNYVLDLSNELVERTKLAEKAPEFDKAGPKLENGKVSLPPGNEEIYREFGKAGLYAIFAPENYEGMGLPYTLYTGFTEIVSRACGSTGLGVAVQGSVIDILTAFGNEEQKAKYLPKLAKGEIFGSVAFTEPVAGSDLANTKTTATDEGDYFILNGQKQFITNGGFSEIYVVLARTDPEKGKKGYSQLLLERGMEGFSVGRLEKKYGLEGSPTAVLNFDNVKVPKSNLLGTRGEGLKQTILGLSGGERIGVAAWSTGIAYTAYLEAKEYSQIRKAFGQPIGEIPIIKAKLEKMEKQLDTARKAYVRAAVVKDTGGPWALEASIAKLYASEAAVDITYQNQQIHGGNGITRDYPAERHVRDVRTATIGGGTSEIQQLIITRNIKQKQMKFMGEDGPWEKWLIPEEDYTILIPKGLIDWGFWGIQK